MFDFVMRAVKILVVLDIYLTSAYAKGYGGGQDAAIGIAEEKSS